MGDSISINEPPERMTSLVDVAAMCGPLLRDRSWLHRRVHKIMLTSEGFARSEISIDFTIPDGLPSLRSVGNDGPDVYFVPLIGLRKWPPLGRLDLRDQHGESFPLLTTDKNRAVDAAALVAMAPEGELKDVAAAMLAEIPGAPDDQRARPLLESLGTLVATHAKNLARDDAEAWRQTLVAAAALASNHILWARITGRAGERLVVKVCFEIAITPDIGLRRRVFSSLSWAPLRVRTTVHDMGAGTSYHMQIEPPAALEIHRARLSLSSSADAVTQPLAAPGPVRRLARWRGLFWGLKNTIAVRWSSHGATHAARVKTQEAERPVVGATYALQGERRAHLYVHGERARVGVAEVDLASVRRGLRPAAALLGVTMTALLGTMSAIAEGAVHNVDATVAALVIAPALLAFVVVRPSEQIAQARLTGVQLLGATAAGLPVLAALALLSFEQPDAGTIRPCWVALTIVCATITVMLMMSWLLPPIKERPEEWRNPHHSG